MVAKHTVMVQSGRGVQYKFEIHRKYTVIRGDSATGKTTLVHLIEDATVRKTADISCDVPCVVLPVLNWELNLSTIESSIVFIDEDHPALAQGVHLFDCMKVSDNCFVIISRDRMPWLPYSYKEIFEIKSSGKFHSLKRVYEERNIFVENDRYVVEDEAAGLEYFRYWYGNCVESSYGNSNLSKYSKAGITLVGDGAAIGPYMYELMLSKADLFLPESFEWLLLHSPIFENNDDVKKILQQPENYIDTEYQSWEEFFTEYLIKISTGEEYQYSKKKLNPCYVKTCCFKLGYCDGFTTKSKEIF